jgi:hypothetical protein
MAERAVQQGSIESAGGSGLRASHGAHSHASPAVAARQRPVVIVPLQIGQSRWAYSDSKDPGATPRVRRPKACSSLRR